MQRRYETIEGTAITVDDYGGTGRPIVLVHGLGGASSNWSLVGPQLAEIGSTVAFDLPGHGRAGPVPRHDLESHVRTTIAVIERQGVESVTLVGCSMGGLVAEIVAAQRPDLVDALILLAPATPPPTLVMPKNPKVAARLAVQSIPGIGPLATAALTSRLTPKRQVEMTLGIVMQHPELLPTDAFERSVELARLRRTMPWAGRAFSESVASVLRLLIRRPTYLAILEQIEAPTTLIFGSEDQVVVPVGLRWLAERQSAWRSIELADAGHTPMLERPDIVVREIERLINRCAPALG
ncbi:MAG: alpha/beta hydrolase [Acidimicrobiia bacterium]